MTRIIVIPEMLQELSVQFARAGSDLQDLGGRLNSILGTLDWEVRQRAGVEGAVGQAHNHAAQLGEQMQEMSRFLALKAEAFYQADNQSAQLVAMLPRPVIPTAPAIYPWWEQLKIAYIGFLSNVSRELKATSLMKQHVKDAAEALKDVKGLNQAEWVALNDDERLDTLQKVEDALAAAQRRPSVELRWASDLEATTACQYIGSTAPSFIKVNNTWLAETDLHEALTLLAHESRHAYQHYAIENSGVHPDKAQVESWLNNYTNENYIELTKNFKGYWNQPVERDARHFGDLFADKFVPQGYLSELEEEYDEVAKGRGWLGGDSAEQI